MKYVPLHVHSDASLLDGLSHPSDIATRAKEIGSGACALTDHGVLSNAVGFVKAMQKEKLKPILGCELYICADDASIRTKENSKLTHLVVLAKNLAGWKQLMLLVSESNDPDLFYRRPRLDAKRLSKYAGNIIAFSGHLGSHLAMCLFGDNASAAFNVKSETEAKALLDKDWKQHATLVARMYEGIFGKGNFFIEIQLIDKVFLPAQAVVSECLRCISKETGIPAIATPDAHYTVKDDAADQRVLICTNLKTTMLEIEKKLEDDEGVMMGCFFRSDNYHIPTEQEMLDAGHTREELDNTVKIAELCESYSILDKPKLPMFATPKGQSPDEYLRELCRIGWKTKISDKGFDEQIYVERIKKELEILQGAGLSSYFLIVRDIVDYVRKQGWLPGPGRGSAAGCLVSYLIGITSIDPIKYDLVFERFYNAGRNTKDRVALPDIDIDIPANHREEIISYIKDKYGHDKVAQMSSFQTIKGRGALKAVLRAYGVVSFEEMNLITAHIPDEAKIAGELQEMLEEEGESSIIKWALEHRADKLKEWCYMDEEGVLQGPLSKRFEQAIRLERTKSAHSKHAAGIIIASEPLSNLCPMVLDKQKQPIVGYDMYDSEDIGLIKIDILGVAFLDKIMGVQKILKTGELHGKL